MSGIQVLTLYDREKTPGIGEELAMLAVTSRVEAHRLMRRAEQEGLGCNLQSLVPDRYSDIEEFMAIIEDGGA